MQKPGPGLSYRTSLRWTEVEARAALSALAASKLSVREFAEREGLDVQRLYSWRHKIGAGVTAQPAFVEIGGVIARERVEIVLRSGIVLRVAESIEPVALRRIAEALESAC